MRWTDLKECCDYYNINYKSLCTYMQKNKISKEEAFSHYYQYYKYNRFTYNHVTYDSFVACCMAYEINRSASGDMQKESIFCCGMRFPAI